MVSLGRVLRTGLWLIAGAALLGAASPARRRDNEQDLLRRLEQETRPVKKAKYEIRLARLKLLEAQDAVEQGGPEKVRELLDQYLARIRTSWQLLQSSGRNAVRKPEGFKDLDIALRRDGRILTDLSQRLPYFERGDVEATVKEVERIRAEVIKVLFPPARPRGKAERAAPPREEPGAQEAP
jgi:hypothetical protein